MLAIDEINIPKFDWDKLREEILASGFNQSANIKVTLPENQEMDNGVSKIPTGFSYYPTTLCVEKIKKARQSGISGHHCVGKDCQICKVDLKIS